MFELTPPQQPGQPWIETTLHTFQGYQYGDGDAPGNGLIQDAEGNLYGTTGYGGDGPCLLLGTPLGCGTVYELIRPKSGETWTEKILYSFQGGQDGQLPLGPLAFDKIGNLYGATEFGGGSGDTCNPLYPYCGTIFELVRPRSTGHGTWTEKVLHSFAGVETGDGANPNGGLVFDGKGLLYGTTAIGGANCTDNSRTGCGILYSLSPPAEDSLPWTETILYSFGATRRDGGGPNGDLVFDKIGNLYGTTIGGGYFFSWGTVFRFSHQPGGGFAETVIYSFQAGNDGGNPVDGVTFDEQGNLYGTASQEGNTGGGTLYRILAESHAFQIVYTFKANPDGFYPDSHPICDAHGNLYGTTAYGGDGQDCGNNHCGTVYMITQ